MLLATFPSRVAIARRLLRRLSRIVKGLRTRCYSPLALADSQGRWLPTSVFRENG